MPICDVYVYIAHMVIAYSIIVIIIVTYISNSVIVDITLPAIWNLWTIILEIKWRTSFCTEALPLCEQVLGQVQ